ncbi:MAG TPA: S24 family peptidase [Thermoanaerobaculia bacterium]|nr:S24 family peptidase [Thermoanaerobaculia bacterium]
MTWRNRLRFAIARSGKAPDDVAFAAGISSNTLQRILDGKYEPDVEEVVHLAAVLGVTVGSLVGEEPTGDVIARPVAADEIPAAFASRGATLAFEVSGSALLGVGIADGDVLFVRPAGEVRKGEMFVRRRGDHFVVQLLFTPGDVVVGIIIGRSGVIS